MVYDHMVKANGKYYQAGEDVPKIKYEAEGENSLPFSDKDIELEENSAGKQYTKSEIQRMNTTDLQSLASKQGIENAFEMSGNELKKMLVEHFGL